MFCAYHGWNACDTASSQFKSHAVDVQLNGDLVIDSPWMFLEAVASLTGHAATVLDDIQRGHKALVIGLDGIQSDFFCFRFVDDLCQVYYKSEDPQPAVIFHIDANHRHTRQGGQHSTVYFNPI